MSAPSAKVRKRAAVQSLRVLAKDVGIDMIGKSRQPDMSKEEFEKLHKEVLSVATQEEHIAKSPNSWFLAISGGGYRFVFSLACAMGHAVFEISRNH